VQEGKQDERAEDGDEDGAETAQLVREEDEHALSLGLGPRVAHARASRAPPHPEARAEPRPGVGRF
jgi:hypothetical protein